MTKQEKLFFLLDRIDDARTITPSGRPIKIDPIDDLNNQISYSDLEYLFEKLKVDGKVISVVNEYTPHLLDPSTNRPFPYLIEILERFDKYVAQIHQTQAYKRFISRNIQEPEQIRPLNSYKLMFYPEDGIAEYRSAQYQFSGKARALLQFLNGSKNTPFSLDDIKAKCNPLIPNKLHQFKQDKDTRDTVNYIRKKLKVNKGEFFPVYKRNSSWIWLEK